MASLKELMGHEIYDLIYTHYDINGCLIGDYEDVLYCDDDEIDQSRISKLEALLVPAHNARETLIPLAAARLLAAWGCGKAIDYYEYCIDSRIDKIGNLEPHRLYPSYDTTYEQIADSLFKYYVRYAERDFIISRSYDGGMGMEARDFIKRPLVKIIRLSKEIIIDMGGIIRVLSSMSWMEYLPVLKDCYLDLIRRPDHDLNRVWNIEPIKNLLMKWEPGFLKED